MRAINGGFRLGGTASSGTVVRCDELVGDLFAHLSELLVERVFFEGGAIRLAARTREAEATCPGCAAVSNRVHSTYGRSLAGTTVGDRPALIEPTVRRLYERNFPSCTSESCSPQLRAATATRHDRPRQNGLMRSGDDQIAQAECRFKVRFPGTPGISWPRTGAWPGSFLLRTPS